MCEKRKYKDEGSTDSDNVPNSKRSRGKRAIYFRLENLKNCVKKKKSGKKVKCDERC